MMIEDANRNVRKWRKRKFKTEINIEKGMDVDLNTPMREALENAMYEHDGISDVSANRVMYHIYDTLINIYKVALNYHFSRMEKQRTKYWDKRS